MEVLNEKQINYKLDRIAFQIAEDNIDDSTLYLVGIIGNGYTIAQSLGERLRKITQQEIIVLEVRLDKRFPLDHDITFSIPLEKVDDHTIILVDDVINSGKTMQYALAKLLEHNRKRIKTTTLVDRKHRDFPIRCDYVGLTLSTTLQDHIEVSLSDVKKAYLV